MKKQREHPKCSKTLIALTPSPKRGRRGTRVISPLSQTWERGWG